MRGVISKHFDVDVDTNGSPLNVFSLAAASGGVAPAVTTRLLEPLEMTLSRGWAVTMF
jgi:hypothetical protein